MIMEFSRGACTLAPLSDLRKRSKIEKLMLQKNQPYAYGAM